MKKSLALLLVLIAFATAACGDHLNGKVVAKDVKPGYSYTYMQPLTTTSCSGSPVVCRTTTSGFIPIVYYVPPCYQITVKGETKDESGTTCLDEAKWESTDIGDTYVGADVDPKDRKEKA